MHFTDAFPQRTCLRKALISQLLNETSQTMTWWIFRTERAARTTRRAVLVGSRAWRIAWALILLAGGGGLTTGTDPAAAEDLPPGLLAHWSFESLDEGRIEDSSGNRLHGQIVGEPERVEGVCGHALRMDGLADHVVIPAAADLDFSTATFSVTAWVNVYGLSGEQQMILAKNVYAQNQREWGLMIDRDQRFRFYLWREGQWRTLESETRPVPGHWYQVAVTLQSGQAGLYVNGQLEARADLGQPVPVTAAPLTIGGVDNAGQLMQQLFGAVDEIRLYDRALSAEEIAGGYTPVSATHELPQDRRFILWDPDQPLPSAAEIPVLENVEFRVIKPYEFASDGYRFLHGVALAWHGDRLYASFGHNQHPENLAGEEARGRYSDDGGRTWSEIFTIESGDVDGPTGVSHGVFLSQGGKLWAFQGAFGESILENCHTRAYVLDKATGNWEPRGVVVGDGFFPLQEPQEMADGNWIMGGARIGQGHPPAVAISRGADFTRWDLVVLPHRAPGRLWGESSVILLGERVLNVARYGQQALALAAVSEDYGRTWQAARPSNLPMAASKPYTGTLSTGEHYLICTTTADSGNRRQPLTIALTRPGESLFSRVYVLRHAEFPEGPGESHPNAALAYPYAIEHEGKLYVGYSNSGGGVGRSGEGRALWNNNSAEMAIIPLESLAVE